MFAIALIAGMFLIGSVAVARADFCVDISILTPHIVGKGFSLPGKGACHDFRGFFQGTAIFLNGQACGSSNGDHITFVLYGSALSSAGLNDIGVEFPLNRDTLTGTGAFCETDIFEGVPVSVSCSQRSFQKVPCNPSTVPMP